MKSDVAMCSPDAPLNWMDYRHTRMNFAGIPSGYLVRIGSHGPFSSMVYDGLPCLRMRIFHIQHIQHIKPKKIPEATRNSHSNSPLFFP